MEQLLTTAAVFAIGFLVTRVEAGCSLTCAEDALPVCAHDLLLGYKDFPDKCAMDQANHCKRGNWNFIHKGACTPTEIGGCPSYPEPVCGYSPTKGYKSFINKCFLKVASELLDYTFAHDGACTPTEVPPSKCPGVCTLEFAPICGYSPISGYHTFPNKCQLEQENTCYFGWYTEKHPGPCNDKELQSNCKRPCTKEFLPVCGRSAEKGYKTFNNICLFHLENGCPLYDSDYKLVHAGACKTEEIASFCDPRYCQDIGGPVCASSPPYFRTFRSKCLFFVENSCKFGDFQLVHIGECTQKENKLSCSAKCPLDPLPVCGFSFARGYKTFLNRCSVSYENACYDSDYGTVHPGECKKEELETICDPKYCLKNGGKEVCGLSPTKGYTTFDNECFLFAQNTCKYGDYKFAHFGECTKVERGTICLPHFCLKPGIPVCGYSKKTGYYTFSNQCFLNAENICKDGAFILKHEGKCTDFELGGKCPVTCTQDCQFLCARSPTLGFKTFYNKCNFEAENNCFGGDYKFYHDGECSKTELENNCQLLCTYEYKPVCALSPTKGYYTFPNKCFYIKDVTCYGSDYKFAYGGICNAHEAPLPPPPSKCDPADSVCTLEYKPVCGYNKALKVFQTFSNKCFFDADNKCKYNYDLIFAHDGPCSKDELVNNCYRLCSEEESPVCAISPTLGYKSFKNTCKLLLGLSCYRLDFTLAHVGKCTPQEAPTCTKLCDTSLSPVCGFSPSKKLFKTFTNKCKWEYENLCLYGDYVFSHPGACTPYEIENNCDRVCATIYSPVCGYGPKTGYKTLPNICSFIYEITCRGGDFVFSNVGECKYPEGPQKDCPPSCLHEKESPVCAFSSTTKSFKSFNSPCLLAADNRCNYADYVLAHDGPCTKDEIGKKCYRKCKPDYKPVCGFNVKNGYRTFPSFCELEVANKCDGADYLIAHEGKCTPKELGGLCKHNCPLYYVGVCAFSKAKGFKTFASDCFLDRENTCTNSDYKLAHVGKCTLEETGKKCNHICQQIYAPICGKSPSKGYKTFPNFCHLDKENSCFYLDFNVIHQGECFPWELCVNCKH